MSNFEFLKNTKEYALFAPAVMEAERVYASAPAMCVVALKEEKNEVADMVKEYQRRRDYAVKAINEIDGLSCRCPKGAFYIFINIEKLGMSGQEFAPLLLENAKVAMVPGDVFGSEGDHYIRMSFANSYENVVEGCKRLKEFVEKIRK